MERLSEAFAVTFLGGVLCSLMLFVPLWGPQLVFMRLATRRPAQACTYSTTDAMVLTFYLALANALVALTRNEMETGWLLALALAANVFVVLIWIKCQRFMRERSIERQLSRLLVEAILYPVSVIAVGILSFNILALLTSLQVFEDGLITGTKRYFYHPLVIAAALTLLVAITVIFALRSSFHRFVTIGYAGIAIERQSDLGNRAAEPTDEREPE